MCGCEHVCLCVFKIITIKNKNKRPQIWERSKGRNSKECTAESGRRKEKRKEVYLLIYF